MHQGPRKIAQKPFSDVAQVVTLLVNQPTPENYSGNLIIPYVLRFRCDEKVKISIKEDGKPVIVVIDIGLTRPLFVVDSKDWQQNIIEDSLSVRRTTSAQAAILRASLAVFNADMAAMKAESTYRIQQAGLYSEELPPVASTPD
jgi:hypothetical protein